MKRFVPLRFEIVENGLMVLKARIHRPAQHQKPRSGGRGSSSRICQARRNGEMPP